LANEAPLFFDAQGKDAAGADSGSSRLDICFANEKDMAFHLAAQNYKAANGPFKVVVHGRDGDFVQHRFNFGPAAQGTPHRARHSWNLLLLRHYSRRELLEAPTCDFFI
jgi:hypothetical protein